MEVSGTLHLYSGEDREFFFVFDDDVAKQLYEMKDLNSENKAARRVYISVGAERFINQRTLSFSKKQREIKVSLCSAATKNDLGSLTRLYDWFAPVEVNRPKVISIMGTLRKVVHDKTRVWELALEEPTDLVLPPGFKRRAKLPSKARRAYNNRRTINTRDLFAVGRFAEQRVLAVLKKKFPQPQFSCLWRDEYLDSEKESIREQGIICDIDIWDNTKDRSAAFIEVKAQQIRSKRQVPLFYLSSAEWRSMQNANAAKLGYRVWLVQYNNLENLKDDTGKIKVFEIKKIRSEWITHDGMIVSPLSSSMLEIDQN